MPWHAITLSANGDIKPCCQFSNKGRLPNTEHDTIMENFNSERMQDLRKDFLKVYNLVLATVVGREKI